MRQVAIIADSVACVPPDVAEKYDILNAPFHISMDGQSYLETEIDKEQLYTRLRGKENLPTTSPASPGETLELYRKAGQRAAAVLYIVMTSGFSQAFNSATQAKKLASEQLPDLAIEVFDSLSVGGAEMLIAIEAAKAASEGKSLAEVTQIANRIKQRVVSFALRPSLFHFDRSGRVGSAKDWAKSQLPTVTVLETSVASKGATKPILRERKLSKAIATTLDIVAARSQGKKLHFGITHTNAPDKAEGLKREVLSRFNQVELYIREYSPVAVVINGEGMVEFGFYAED
ncbi:MAG: DegV family protein [Dehalococcoidales bacterium]|nr:DegV family protein [Dehalococcoidales bacterium]